MLSITIVISIKAQLSIVKRVFLVLLKVIVRSQGYWSIEFSIFSRSSLAFEYPLINSVWSLQSCLKNQSTKISLDVNSLTTPYKLCKTVRAQITITVRCFITTVNSFYYFRSGFSNFLTLCWGDYSIIQFTY